MSPKQKRALVALILAALAGGLAAFAPGVSCDVDEAVIEDLIPDESSDSSGSPAAPATNVAPGSESSSGSGSSSGSSSGG